MKFEVGKRYKLRYGAGWVEYIGRNPYSKYGEAVFVLSKGILVERTATGRMLLDVECDSDVLPEEWVEPRKDTNK